MKLYQVAVILVTPEHKEIIVEPCPVLAVSDDAAKLQASRKVPRQWDEHLSSMQVLIRPFA